MGKQTTKQMNDIILKHPEILEYIQCTGKGHIVAREAIEKLKNYKINRE